MAINVYADIYDGECVNVVVFDGEPADDYLAAFPDHDFVGPIDDLDPRPGIGWSYHDGEWLPPPSTRDD